MKIDFSTIPNALAFVTVRLECTGPNGNTSQGTGFFFDFGGTIGRTIITNKHVIDDMNFAKFFLTHSSTSNEPMTGMKIMSFLSDLQTHCICHPNPDIDLAVLPMNHIKFLQGSPGVSSEDSPRAHISTLNATLIRTQNQLNSLRLIEEIVMIGYPIGLSDEANNLPLVRRGITATHPAINFNGAHEFLIDCAVFAGSSGSPIFRYTPEFPMKSGDGISIQGGEARVELLGILSGGYERTVNGDIKWIEIPTALQPVVSTNVPVSIGQVIRAERILEMEQVLQANLP